MKWGLVKCKNVKIVYFRFNERIENCFPLELLKPLVSKGLATHHCRHVKGYAIDQ